MVDDSIMMLVIKKWSSFGFEMLGGGGGGGGGCGNFLFVFICFYLFRDSNIS